MENTEFKALVDSAGWSQAEAARQLGMTSGAVNQIVKGTVKPSPVTMRLLRLLVGGRPNSIGGGIDWKARALAAERTLESIRVQCIEALSAARQQTLKTTGSTADTNSDVRKKGEAQSNERMEKDQEQLGITPKLNEIPGPSRKPSTRNILPDGESIVGRLPD